MVDFNNIASIKDRYIGGHLGAECGELLIVDGGSVGTIPKSNIASTFTELGLPWIDRAILRRYDRGRIFTLFHASAQLGAFYPDLASFIRSNSLIPDENWQCVVYKSGTLENSYLKYIGTPLLFKDYPEWSAGDKHIVCLDYDFQFLLMAIIAVFLIGITRNPKVSLRRFLCYMTQWPSERRGTIRRHSHVRRNLHDALREKQPGSEELAHKACTINREELVALGVMELIRFRPEFHFWQELGNGSFTEWFNQCMPEGNQREALLNCARSLIFHFIAGHEIGHCAYAQKSRVPKTEQFVQSLRQSLYKLLPDTEITENAIEEAFCDIIGARNCAERAHSVGAPASFTVLIVTLIWLTASGESSVDQKAETVRLIRRVALDCALGNVGATQDSRNMCEGLLNSGIKVIRDKLRIVDSINRILNPNPGDNFQTIGSIV